jgi:hypothetical protein
VTDFSATVGFVVIVILYAGLGLLAAAGSVAISQRLFRGRSEQILYAIFLVPIAGFYLAFVAYFKDPSPWSIELLAALAFSLLGIFGARYAAVLILGYLLHGAWDALHELAAHGGWQALAHGQLTEIPLAYGVFCAVFDVAIAAYCARRSPLWKQTPPAHG